MNPLTASAACIALLLGIGAVGSYAQLPATAPGSSRGAPLQGAAEEYRLGSGDVVKITVYNNTDLTTEAEIAQDGKIGFPLVGAVTIGGLTRAEAEKAISQSLGTGAFVPNAHVNMLVTQYRSRQVSVMGEVQKPGKYPISQTSNVTDLLAAAGGITAKGSNLITIIKKDANGQSARQQVNVKDVLGSGQLSKNVRIDSDDIIFVPPTPVFYIYGEVRQPGAYPLAADMTVRQALSVGGGLTIRGTERGIKVERRGQDGKPRSHTIQLSDKLNADDVVQVAESWF
jgi:polysaccharide export outer membrane protein